MTPAEHYLAAEAMIEAANNWAPAEDLHALSVPEIDHHMALLCLAWAKVHAILATVPEGRYVQVIHAQRSP